MTIEPFWAQVSEPNLRQEWHSVFPLPSLFWESWGFLSSSQNHALDQRIRDIGRMSEDRRPLFLRQQFGHLADQSVSQRMQLIDQPDIVRARAKVERCLRHQGRQRAKGKRQKGAPRHFLSLLLSPFPFALPPDA